MRHPQKDKGTKKAASNSIRHATHELFGEEERERGRQDTNSRESMVWIIPGVLVPANRVTRMNRQSEMGAES